MGTYSRKRRDGMAIVLIHWRIWPNKESVEQFLDWWCKEATIRNKSGLLGEFLSAPVPEEELGLPVEVDDLGASDSSAKAWRFVNVGLWRDHRTFVKEVGHLMTDKRQSFEAGERTRTVFEPQHWRLGDWKLPEATCD
jgi:hypothetical protein